MKYFFEDLEAKRRLRNELDSWIGTPFRHKCGVKGLGCDCIHFVAGVLKQLGLLRIDDKEWPDYPRDWHLHSTRSLLIENLEKYLNVEKVGIPELCGDICIYKYGLTAAHAGIFCEGYIYQSVDDIGVQKISKDLTPFNKRLFAVYRILA